MTIKHCISRWGPAGILMTVIFGASATSADHIPSLPRGDNLLKKGGHALGYALLSLAYLRGLGPEKRYARWQALLLAALFALSDEAHQASTPGRKPSLRDVGIDTAGAAVGLLLHWLCPALRRWVRCRED